MQGNINRSSVAAPNWLSAYRHYLVFTAGANLVWEFAQMPFYTLWRDGTWGEIVFAGVHCTGGDILITLAALATALILFGSPRWPTEGYGRVALATMAVGIAYTIFSEWLNTEIRGAWAYSEFMPVLPVIGTGLVPLMQWVLIPAAGFRFIRYTLNQEHSLERRTNHA